MHTNIGLEIPAKFAAKSSGQIRDELLGFPDSCVDAVLRLREAGGSDDLFDPILPGMITFHLPRGAAPPPEIIPDCLSLKQDLGLDSLSLTEMAFKCEELFGITIDMNAVVQVETVGDLKVFLKSRFAAAV